MNFSGKHNGISYIQEETEITFSIKDCPRIAIINLKNRDVDLFDGNKLIEHIHNSYKKWSFKVIEDWTFKVIEDWIKKGKL